MAGVGETGVWRTGVWVEPLDADGQFSLTSTAALSFAAGSSAGGAFALSAEAELVFDGSQFGLGVFGLDATSDLTFTGDFEAKPGQGIFGLEATAELFFAWVPDVGQGPGDAIPVVPPADAAPKLKPGDAFVFNGVSGICHLDEHGRLVVIDHRGQVLCVIGPSEVDYP